MKNDLKERGEREEIRLKKKKEKKLAFNAKKS